MRVCRSDRLCLATLATLIFSAGSPLLAQQPGAPGAVVTTPAAAPQPANQAQGQPPKPPLPNRANDLLPAWLRVRGEFRERMEGFNGGGFVEGREDLYWLSRFRVNATATASKHLAFQVQVQDARVAKKQVGPTGSPFRSPFDLRTAFADVGSTTTRVAARVGRQELAFGDQRLVGHANWLNAARTFDAARVTFRTKAFTLDTFGASVVRVLDGAFDRSGNGNRFAGAYATTRALVPGASVEPYVFWRRDRDVRAESGLLGELQQTTVGVRWAGTLPARLDYGIEAAVQAGSVDSDTIRAWASHWHLRESLPGRGAIKLTGEYNVASGDTDPADGRRGTFDQLYPTAHDKYGLADQVGWRNLHHVRTGFEVTPLKGLVLSTNYHGYWLAERRDGLYAASGALLARVPAGAASTRVGQEIDVQASRALSPQLALAAGYAHLFTGPFLKEATPGASYSHPYVMLTYIFLAEK